VPDQEVHVAGDRIVWAGPRLEAPTFADAARLELADAFLLPGLGDAHAHFALLDPPQPKIENVPQHMALCLEIATNALQGGFTMLRVLGGAYGVDIAMRDMFDRSAVLGPRLWVAGEALTPSAGHMAGREEAWGIRVCDGADGFRAAARAQLQAGADHLKLVVTGGAIGSAHDVTNAVTVTDDEARAAADVFHSRGRPVVVHASCPAGVELAARIGSRTVEHGYDLDERSIQLLVDHGMWLTPTLAVTHQLPGNLLDEYEKAALGNRGLPAWYMKRREERFAVHRAAFERARDAGVKILAGPDTGPRPGASHCELAFLSRAGMSAYDVIVAATLSFAEAVDASDDLGTVEAGKLADLIAVAENPLVDVRRLRHPLLVLRGGQFAVDPRRPN